MFNEVSKQGFCQLCKTLNEVLNEVVLKVLFSVNN